MRASDPDEPNVVPMGGVPPGSVVDMPAPFCAEPGQKGSARVRKLLPAAISDGAANGARIEPALEQFLTQLTLRGEAQEQPRARGERDQRALAHHHRPRARVVM